MSHSKQRTDVRHKVPGPAPSIQPTPALDPALTSGATAGDYSLEPDRQRPPTGPEITKFLKVADAWGGEDPLMQFAAAAFRQRRALGSLPQAPTLDPWAQVTFSRDFRACTWGVRLLSFNLKTSEVLVVLWRHRLVAGGWVHNSTVAKEAWGLARFNPHDVFRPDHAALRFRMIGLRRAQIRLASPNEWRAP